ncbi:MAG: polyprenyl synthetase family protein [Bacteroidota bacterium]
MSSSRSDTVQLRSPSASEPTDRVAALVAHLDERLARLALPESPPVLYEPIRYVLSGGGKRLRPVLLSLTAEALGADPRDAMPAALAVEVFHNFTLVHDDIMDHAAQRRGRATVHRVWDESTAILVGDAMMGLSYDLLAQTPTGDLRVMLQVYGRMVARLCEGQALDMAFEQAAAVTVQDYLCMIEGKTAALLECCFELGALVAGADAPTRAHLVRAGRQLGRAFQIQDDLLDLTAQAPGWGKTIGGDLIEGKKAYLLLTALEQTSDVAIAEGRATADDAAFFRAILEDGGLDPDWVGEARARMDELGVLAHTRAEVARHTEEGREALAAALPPSEVAATLLGLVERMGRRGV